MNIKPQICYNECLSEVKRQYIHFLHFESKSCIKTHLAGLASGENAVRFLSISASVVDIAVGETSVPHHDTAESSVVAVLGD